MIFKHKLDGVLAGKLSQLHDAPKQLFYRGVDPNLLLNKPSVAIVGSRKMTAYGKTVAEQFARELAQAGVVIISGLALGVDSAAHRATVEAGGLTLAVMAHGLHTVQPSSHVGLAQQILQGGGTLVSEYPVDYPALSHNFVARDRLIAALADAVLIPEAAVKSGSLHTAAFALDLGKPVLAVPGPITSEMSAGTNQLIKTGALTVTSVDDVFLALNLQKTSLQQTLLPASDEEQLVLEALRAGATEGQQLMAVSGLSSTIYSQTMTMLEISGQIRALGGDKWALY